MRFIDTNIFLRYLIRSDAAKADACFGLFQRVKHSEEQVTTCEAVIAEVMFVLCSPRQYHLSHVDAAARLRPLLNLGGLKMPDKRVYLRALELFAEHTVLDFEDAVIMAHMERQGIDELVSYDTDFDKVTGIVRREPEGEARTV